MGLSKTQAFTEEQNQFATWAHALGHPARVAILQYLAQTPGCVCGDLVDVLPLAQATVSQHLKVLKKAGLITGEISGPRTCYCINESEWMKAQTTLTTFFKETATAVDNECC